MEPVLTALLVASGGGALFRLLKWSNRSRRRAWREAAEANGIEVAAESTAFGFFHGLRGPLVGTPLTVDLRTEKYGAVITVLGFTHLRDLRLCGEGVLDRLVAGRDVQIGDAAFDFSYLIRGPAALAQATLDAATRDCVTAVFGGTLVFDVPQERRPGTHPPLPPVRVRARAELAHGTLRLSLSGEQDDAQRMGGVLRLVVALAHRLVAPRDIVRALAENARSDPLAGVRRQSLHTLCSAFRRSRLCDETLRAACDDPDDSVALAAAMERGGDGQATLLRLATDSQEDGIAAAAMRALQPAPTLDQGVALLDEAVGNGRMRKACAALSCLAALPDTTAAARVEPLLLAILDWRDPETTVAAAQLLGRVGSPAAVLPLQEAAARFSGAAPRAAARWAVGAIHERLHGAAPGQVSLAGDAAGEVSLADDAGGRLSMDEKD